MLQPNDKILSTDGLWTNRKEVDSNIGMKGGEGLHAFSLMLEKRKPILGDFQGIVVEMNKAFE